MALNQQLTSRTKHKILQRSLARERHFEKVETYFKICGKYHLPTFEEPYYFLTEQRHLEIKLECDTLKPTTIYNKIEIHVSILEAFS